MTPGEMVAYESGLMHGIDIGRRQVEDEVTAEWARVREVVAQTVARPSFAELCERRGEHDRADRARQTLTARGVMPRSTARRVA